MHYGREGGWLAARRCWDGPPGPAMRGDDSPEKREPHGDLGNTPASLSLSPPSLLFASFQMENLGSMPPPTLIHSGPRYFISPSLSLIICRMGVRTVPSWPASYGLKSHAGSRA